MMRSFLLSYWFIGCFSVGAAMVLHANQCPADKLMSGIDAFGAVAVWPVALSYVMLAKNRVEMRCEAP